MDSWQTQVRKGLVELVILALLESEETHGYGLVQRLKTHPLLAFTESTVYPVLTRLEREGALAVRQAASPSGPPRRCYQLTEKGRNDLKRMREGWIELRTSLDRLLRERMP